MVVGDRIAVLRNGQIRQVSIPFTIYNEPKSIFVADFVGGANFLEGFIAERDQHGSWVQLRHGLVLRIRETGYSPGERVVLAVREEMTGVARRIRRREEINLFSGTVESTTFLGNLILYEVLLENGDVVNSRVPVYLDKKRISSGDRVYVRLKPESVKTYLYPQAGLLRELEVI